jgi:hypothetical protein
MEHQTILNGDTSPRLVSAAVYRIPSVPAANGRLHFVEGIAAQPYLNGLPLVEEELEVVGDAVKFMVQIPPSVMCDASAVAVPLGCHWSIRFSHLD